VKIGSATYQNYLLSDDITIWVNLLLHTETAGQCVQNNVSSCAAKQYSFL